MFTIDTILALVSVHAYLGIFLLLLLGGLGVPVPEELPVIAAGVLSGTGFARWWMALPVCVLGILSGDAVLYGIGRRWGEQVLGWRVVRRLLSAPRAARLEAAYRRHAVKTIVVSRHAMGLRCAAFLTAGIARVPFWKFVGADAAAVLLGVPLSFGLAYAFADQVEAVVADVRRVEHWVTLGGLILLAVASAMLVRRWARRGEVGLGEGRVRALWRSTHRV